MIPIIDLKDDTALKQIEEAYTEWTTSGTEGSH